MVKGYFLVCVFGLLMVSNVCAQIDTMAVLRRGVEDYPQDDRAWMRLGRAFLDMGNLDGAQQAFEKAIRLNKTAEAYTGLGRVFAARGKGSTQKAFQTFRMALGVEDTYAPAQFEIAKYHDKLRNHDAEAAYRRAIEMDPNFSPAYRALILWYERAQLDWEKELAYVCQQYIARWPDDAMGYYHLALIYVEKHEYNKVYRLAEQASLRFADDLRWTPMMAQAEAARGNPGRALVLFEQFFQQAPAEERDLYNDLSLVATTGEVKALQSVPDHLRDVVYRNFWQTRSGAAMLGADARRAEHYRRVWYAKNYFGRHKEPWDKRGEVYIRYGEPDYRSRSGRENEMPSSAVEQFKTAKVQQMLAERGKVPRGEVVTLPIMMPENVYYVGQRGDMTRGLDEDTVMFRPDWQWEVKTPSGDVRLNLPLDMQRGIGPTALIDRDAGGDPVMPWESWTYVSIGRGLEFTFTDRYMSGQWDFPLVPKTLDNFELRTRVNNTQPAVEFASISSSIPEKFTVPPGVETFDFYYDLASFRGVDGRPQLEVYFGIPPEQIAREKTGAFMRMEMAHDLILANESGEALFHSGDKRVFQARVGIDKMEGLFVDVARVSASPGTYVLGVKLVDQLSGKWNLYQQEVVIPSFADTLAISDIELAWEVSESPRSLKFKKGDVWVLPEPTRQYDGRDVYLYYEVYNLTLDAFGQAKYRVDYTIRENVQTGAGVVGILASGLKRFFQARQEPEFRVGYERSGTALDEPIYFELETSKLKPGLKEVVVSITDLNANRVVSRQALFWVGPPSGSK